jgi:hypothetical protein
MKVTGIAALGASREYHRRIWFGWACEHGGAGRSARQAKHSKRGLTLSQA